MRSNGFASATFPAARSAIGARFHACPPAKFRDGSDAPRAYLERCLETITAREPVVKALTAINESGARAAADASTQRWKAGRPLSPIDGMPVAIKVLHQNLAATGAIQDWRPEDSTFWESTGRAIARRNLWVSVPCLLLSFSVWMVWSVVVAKLPSVGFAFSTEQLFWLAALPGLSGATLRVFYGFMPAIFGGRLWTTLTTWSLLLPALGMGLAVQNPVTPYWIFLGLALLCGLGGGNFASSMAISRSSSRRPRRATHWP